MSETIKDEYVKYLPMFKTEVTKNSKEIDFSNELDWFSLTIGWAIGKGLTPNEAWKLATYIRYKTDLA